MEAEYDSGVVSQLAGLIDLHFPKLLENPSAVKGKKGKEAPVFKERQQKLGNRLNALRK